MFDSCKFRDRLQSYTLIYMFLTSIAFKMNDLQSQNCQFKVFFQVFTHLCVLIALYIFMFILIEYDKGPPDV